MTSTIEITETLQDGFLKASRRHSDLTLEAVRRGHVLARRRASRPPAMPFAPDIATPEESHRRNLPLRRASRGLAEVLLHRAGGLAEPITAAKK